VSHNLGEGMKPKKIEYPVSEQIAQIPDTLNILWKYGRK